MPYPNWAHVDAVVARWLAAAARETPVEAAIAATNATSARTVETRRAVLILGPSVLVAYGSRRPAASYETISTVVKSLYAKNLGSSFRAGRAHPDAGLVNPDEA